MTGRRRWGRRRSEQQHHLRLLRVAARSCLQFQSSHTCGRGIDDPDHFDNRQPGCGCASATWQLDGKNRRGVCMRVATGFAGTPAQMADLLSSVVAVVLSVALGCGGGSSSQNSGDGNSGTPAGSCTVTVTANSGSGVSAITHTLTIQLTVN